MFRDELMPMTWSDPASRGFNAEKFGKIGNLYAVSFASFNNKEPAVKELKRIREEIQPEAWMTGF
jgi:hypothetical protein